MHMLLAILVLLMLLADCFGYDEDDGHDGCCGCGCGDVIAAKVAMFASAIDLPPIAGSIDAAHAAIVLISWIYDFDFDFDGLCHQHRVMMFVESMLWMILYDRRDPIQWDSRSESDGLRPIVQPNALQKTCHNVCCPNSLPISKCPFPVVWV